MESNLSKDFQELVTDQSFIDWVNNPNPDSERHWQQFVVDHPSLKKEFYYAKYIVRRLHKKNKKIDEEQIRELWINIQLKINAPSGKIRTLNKWMVAASIVLLLGIGSLILHKIVENTDHIVDYKSIDGVESEGNEVKLILSDHSEKLIQSEDPSISYSRQGEISIDSTSLSHVVKQEEKNLEEIYNQLIVPYGKRSSLILSDGTIVYLNSGSRVIYPVVFNKEKREIYIEGEAYLKVAHNVKCPFYVTTDHLKVRVLGTEFNIKSYPDENKSSVVLVTGSVQTLINSKKILMKESEQLTLNNISGKISQEKTDVLEHISWKDGWLFCNNEQIESIATKLSRYYNVDIQFKDQNAKMLTMTGKLDLKSEWREVLDIICFTAPVRYEENSEKIIISSKQP
ncbi:MAG: FecR family protein [Mangrovibacterium sp.]